MSGWAVSERHVASNRYWVGWAKSDTSGAWALLVRFWSEYEGWDEGFYLPILTAREVGTKLVQLADESPPT